MVMSSSIRFSERLEAGGLLGRILSGLTPWAAWRELAEVCTRNTSAPRTLSSILTFRFSLANRITRGS